MVTKVPGSGGLVTAATCKEQLLYEVHDPARYLQPDVVADFSGVAVEEDGPDRVRVAGGGGAPRTGMLKVSVGCHEGWFGEGQISYAGPGALARGRLALEIVKERLRLIGLQAEELRFDLIGVDAILGPKLPRRRRPSRARCARAWSAAPRARARRSGSATRWTRSTSTARPAAAA